MSFLDRIAECNLWNPDNFRWFVVDGCRVGRVRQALVPRLADFPKTFEIEDDAVILNPGLATFAARSSEMERVVKALVEDGIVQGWRSENYPVTRSFGEPPFLQMERAAIPHFGVRAFGVHLSGFVRSASGIRMWIGRRAKDKHTYPDMLDNTVAGGQPIGISLRDNLIKECAEEASIPRELAGRAVPVGAITYCMEAPDGLKPDVQFCYDLELPADFTPRNTDGEIAEFYLWPIEQVAEIVRGTREFKFNCNLVVIDFLVRHGVLPPDHPDYVAICQGLRR
jgi:isopentenyldiphosphate isomerase